MGSQGDFEILPRTALRLTWLKAGKGIGLEPPGSKASYPALPNFAEPVLGHPSQWEHLPPASFPAVLHDLPTASLSEREVFRLFLPLPLLGFR